MAYTGFLKDVKTSELKKNLKLFEPGQAKDIRAELEYRGELDKPAPTVSKPTPQLPSVSTPTVAPKPATPNFADIIKKMQEATTKKQVSSLKKARDVGLSALESEKETIAPAYAKARGVAKTESDLAAERFRKLRATQGLAGSGAEAQTGIAQNIARQERLGDISEGETRSLQDIERRRSGIESGLASDIASVEAGGEASSLDRILREKTRLEGIEREDKLRTEADEIRRSDEARDRERRDFLDTIDQYPDIQAEIDKVVNNNDATDDWKIPFLRSARQRKIANIQEVERESARAEQEARQKTAKENQELAFDLWTKAGEIKTQFMADWLGMPIGTRTNDASYRDAQLALQRAKESRLGASRDSSTGQKITTFRKGIDAIVDRLTTRDQYGDQQYPNSAEVKAKVSEYIVNQVANGIMDAEMARTLIIERGLNEGDIQRAEDTLNRNINIVEEFDPLNLRR